ncbi:MAG: nucleotide pyrophosphatase/phosphodiesterase family protein [Phycisphaeraceae bacterium]
MIHVTRCMLLLSLAIATAIAHGADAEPVRTARNTVVWVSIDGLRPDYVDRAETPTLGRLVRQGVHTRQLVPTFPALTFPSHVSQVTGVPVREHGVTSNAFYDRQRDRIYRYPPFANLIEAEPIWLTATRQGVRTAVGDWPMAHWQRGPMQPAYSNERFDHGLTDRDRLEALLDIWQNDDHESPLRLLMTWTGELDVTGHTHGPDADAVTDTMAQTDELLGWFIAGAREAWQATAEPGDALYVLLSTDHGMSAVHTLVHPGRLAGVDGRDDVTLLYSGSIAHVHLHELDAAERERVIERALAAADEHAFARAWRRDDLPERWAYDHPTRSGELVMVLDTGHTFSARPTELTGDADDFPGVRGMHGYDPADDANMLGFAVLWRFPEPLGGGHIERVDALQLHPTVARLLGIDPAEGARAAPIEWETVQEP